MNKLTSTTATLYYRSGFLKNQWVRHALALGWTLFATILLLQPSSQPVIGAPAPPGAPDLMREIKLTAGHIVVFSILVALWWWAALCYLPTHRALFFAVSFVAVFGLITEVAQVFSSNRSPSVYDMVVNWLVTAITALWLTPLRERIRAVH